MSKIAILQVADSGPLESLVVMLRSVGYECLLPDASLRAALRDLRCDTVLDPSDLVKDWGYDPPMALGSAAVRDMDRCDLFVDVKAHRNGPLVWKRWPRLRDRTLWYRINGGKPEHVVTREGFDCGDEANPPCPVLTPNQWYKIEWECTDCKRWREGWRERIDQFTERTEQCKYCCSCSWTLMDRRKTFYTCWPPFRRFGDYGRARTTPYQPPVCFIHNLRGWGYGDLGGRLRDEVGLSCYGRGSPDGLVPHGVVPELLSRAVAMVHLKSSDAPGYALYEALAAGCPVICSRRLIWKERSQDLFVPGETCLVFDREGHQGMTEDDVANCVQEIGSHLERLKDPAENRRIGEAGWKRLLERMWSDKKPEDVASLQEFMSRNFPN